MTNVTQHWAEELKESLDLLKTMRDEMKVQAHLGSMEARGRFSSLETRLENEQLAVRKSFKELIEGFRDLKAQFKENAAKISG